MLNNNRGFSLIELIVVMGIFVVIIAITGNAFNAVMKHASLQSKIAEGNIEGVLGLEMLRKDIASAGFGLPWSFQDETINYSEVNGTLNNKSRFASTFNDSTSNRIRAIVSGNFNNNDPYNQSYDNQGVRLKGSDYLVIRSTNAGSSNAAQRWSYMNYTGAVKPDTVKPLSWTKGNLENRNLVIVERVGLSGTFTKELVMSATSFYTTYGNLANFEPAESKVNYYVYGVDDGNDPNSKLRMPFNRADYYVRVPAAADLPRRCASNTGILYKATINQANGSLRELPLLDCVADMQVVYSLDSTSSGTITETDDISALTAGQIREQLKIIKVYILTHEGGKDFSCNYPNSTIAVGPAGIGRNFDLAANVGPGYDNFRWKVYFLTVKALNINITTQ
jgi:prepilin-type N-terminal cleavage/methylation domain-containing protein